MQETKNWVAKRVMEFMRLGLDPVSRVTSAIELIALYSEMGDANQKIEPC